MRSWEHDERQRGPGAWQQAVFSRDATRLPVTSTPYLSSTRSYSAMSLPILRRVTRALAKGQRIASALALAFVPTACELPDTRAQQLQRLAMAEPVELDNSALCALYDFGSDNTDLQREEGEEAIMGSVIEWSVEVYEVQKVNDSTFRVLTSHCAGPSRAPKVEARLFVSTAEDHVTVRRLKTGSVIRIKGRVSGVDALRYIELDPAALAGGTTLRAALRVASPDADLDPVQTVTRRAVEEESVSSVEDAVAEVKTDAAAQALGSEWGARPLLVPRPDASESWQPAPLIIYSGPLCQAILRDTNGHGLDSLFADIPAEYFEGGEVYFHRDINWIPVRMCERAVSEYREDLDLRVDEGMVDARLIRALTMRLGVSYELPTRTARGRFMEQVHAFTNKNTSFAGHASEIRNVIRANPGGPCELLVRRAMEGDKEAIKQVANEEGPPPVCRDPNP